MTEELRQWRKDRNITEANTKVYVENVLEELLEIYYTDKDYIKEEKDLMMDMFFRAKPISTEDTLDAIQDIQVFSINETELMGYDNVRCNQEVFSEINSRLQDPEQVIEWKTTKSKGKWKKDLQQDVNTLYKADYSKAKNLMRLYKDLQDVSREELLRRRDLVSINDELTFEEKRINIENIDKELGLADVNIKALKDIAESMPDIPKMDG